MTMKEKEFGKVSIMFFTYLLFQLDRPVGVVEELFPALVSLVPEVDMNERIPLGLERLSDKFHTGPFRSPSPFLSITACTRTYDIRPLGFATHTPGDNMIQRKLTGGVFFSAKLTSVSVPCENISAVKFDLASGQAVVEKKPDNSGHCNMEIYS